MYNCPKKSRFTKKRTWIPSRSLVKHQKQSASTLKSVSLGSSFMSILAVFPIFFKVEKASYPRLLEGKPGKRVWPNHWFLGRNQMLDVLLPRNTRYVRAPADWAIVHVPLASLNFDTMEYAHLSSEYQYELDGSVLDLETLDHFQTFVRHNLGILCVSERV